MAITAFVNVDRADLVLAVQGTIVLFAVNVEINMVAIKAPAAI